MLRSYTVANHRSIRDEQELQLLPTYDKGRPAVPVAAIYGANASGKSNLLDSLAWLRYAILYSFAEWQPGSGVPRHRFALDAAYRQRPTEFSVDIVAAGVRHVYRVSLDSEAVRQEQLTAYPSGRPRVVFRREGASVVLGPTVADAKSRSHLLSRLTRDNALFLNVAAINGVEEVNDIYQWFRVGCLIGPGDISERDLAIALEQDGGKALTELVKAADLGIKDIRVEMRVSPDSLKALASLEGRFESKTFSAILEEARAGVLRVNFIHGASNTVLDLESQSAGTRSWINLVSRATAVLRKGGALIVDEVDSTLHPHLTARLVNLFRDPETNTSGAQFIFTTHDATLLDEDVLSRDEIWFVEKDFDSGASRLYPLTDFHPRKSENTEGRYLAGSYGAVPVLADYRFRAALRQGGKSSAAA